MEKIDIINNVTKIIFINVYTYIVFTKLINYKENNNRKIVFILIISIIESILGTILIKRFPKIIITTMVYLFHSLAISQLTKNKLKFSEEYGIIEDEYRPTVLGIALPLRVQVTKARVYTESTATRTKEEALQLGRDLLIQELRTDSSEILSLSFKSQETENGITLYLTAECIANIAEEIKIISPEGE